jgi:hypothetical protein
MVKQGVLDWCRSDQDTKVMDDIRPDSSLAQIAHI